MESGLKREQFGTLTHPGTIIGTINEAVQKQTGLGAVPVIAVAGHDTASAVAAVPAKDEEFAYLSSGTWSLMGIESKKAIINDRSYELNFTNEGGVGGTTRFLKNICGMWLYERCRQEWSELRHLGHLELQKEAWEIEDNESFIFPDDRYFANSALTTQGIGINLQHDFRRFRDIFHFERRRARKQKKAAEAPPAAKH